MAKSHTITNDIKVLRSGSTWSGAIVFGLIYAAIPWITKIELPLNLPPFHPSLFFFQVFGLSKPFLDSFLHGSCTTTSNALTHIKPFGFTLRYLYLSRFSSVALYSFSISYGLYVSSLVSYTCFSSDTSPPGSTKNLVALIFSMTSKNTMSR